MTVALAVSGHELKACIGALAFFTSCPFSQTLKPTLSLQDAEIDDLSNRMMGFWTPVITAASTIQGALRAQVTVTIERRELRILIDVLSDVCNEIGNVPTDMEVIVGARLCRKTGLDAL